MIHFHFITLFPEIINAWLTTSIVGRAHRQKIFDFTTYYLRDFTTDKHKTVDDVAYGGGGGMVLKIEPLAQACEVIKNKIDSTEKVSTIYFSPAGKMLNTPLLHSLTQPKHFILVCGHYEGVDQRFIDKYVDLEISVGNFILTGGELPALFFADAFTRQLKGTFDSESVIHNESFSLKDPDTGLPLLENPHYTRPQEYDGEEVPEVLLSGNHKNIEKWRIKASKEKTNSMKEV